MTLYTPNQMEWLGRVLVKNSFVYLDRWSIMHFFVAIALTIILFCLFKKRVWLIFIIIILAYEIWESRFWDKLWYMESYLNILWDIIVAGCGYLFVYGMKYLIENGILIKESKKIEEEIDETR